MLQAGDIIDGRYRISHELGRGGMALVYQAKDEHLARDVALKVLRPHLTDADQERFRREIQVLATLRHPNIVTIYDLGQQDYLYFVMELVTGGAMTALGPYQGDVIPALHVLDASIAVAEALAYVHKRGMVHRDLTPRNILLSQLGHPKVMDFGLVHLAESSQSLTRTGLTLGTPQYMAPEQAQGADIGAHTDLYAFGAVLYHLLTGIAPFIADNDQAVLYQHVYGDIVPIREHNPEVPRALAELVEAMLHKDPHARPHSGDNLAHSLRMVRSRISQASHGLRSGGAAGQGVQHGGLSLPRSPRVLWQRRLETGPQYPYSMVQAEHYLVLGLPDDRLALLHPSDGSIVGYCPTWDEVTSSPVYQHGTLIACDRSGGLHSYALPENMLLWQQDVGARALCGYAEQVLVSSDSGLACVSSAGKQRWHYPTAAPVTAPALVHRQWILCLSEEKGSWLHVLNHAGKAQYKVELADSPKQLSAAEGIVMLAEFSGELHAFDLADRDVLWSYAMEGELWHAPLLWRRRLIQLSWTSKGCCVRCIALRSGEDVWERWLPQRCTAAPVMAGALLYIVSESGTLWILDAEQGQVVSQQSLSLAPIQASPLLVEGRLYLAATDGLVLALA